MKKILFLILFLVSLISYCQISYPGIPASFDHNIKKTNIYILPHIDVEVPENGGCYSRPIQR